MWPRNAGLYRSHRGIAVAVRQCALLYIVGANLRRAARRFVFPGIASPHRSARRLVFVGWLLLVENPEPFAAFFDVMLLGYGEDKLPAFFDACAACGAYFR